MEMEMEKDSSIIRFPLNYDCAFELLLWLSFDDCMSLAEAFEELQPIADRVYKRKFNELAFDFQQPIDRILYHAGPTAKSLSLTFGTFDNLESDLINIFKTCKELRCLTLIKLKIKDLHSNIFANFAAEDVEMLTLNHCSLANDEDIFDSYKKLKYLNLIKCQEVNLCAMKKCFERNQEITSLVCNIQTALFCPILLDLLPNLERLSLRYISKFMKLDVLSRLKSLRHLTLLCWMENVNDLLVYLAEAEHLEELALVDVVIDDNTFPLIKSLQNLQMLSITTDSCQFPKSSDLPPRIKALKLGGCRGCNILDNDFASTVKHLQGLEAIHLVNCELERNGFWINDFDSIADYVVNEVINNLADRHLNVTLTSDHDNSSHCIVVIRHLRITNFVEDSSKFKIKYPGVQN